MSSTRYALGLVLAAAFPAACGSTGTGGQPDGGGAVSGSGNIAGSAGAIGGGAGGSPNSPSGGAGSQQTCARYLECVAAAAPSQLPLALEAYGPSGTCWQGGPDIASACEQACQSELESANHSSPDEPKCALCQSDADCESPLTCSAALRRCVDIDNGTIECMNVVYQTALGPPDLASCAAESCPAEYAACFGSESTFCPGLGGCLSACAPDCAGDCIATCQESQDSSCPMACSLDIPNELSSCVMQYCNG